MSPCVCVCVFRAEHYWWRGQNRRTLRFGQFPRHVVTAVAGLSAHDISRPLKHSFIHTGHGDTDPHRSWGHADRIDRFIMHSYQHHMNCRKLLREDRTEFGGFVTVAALLGIMGNIVFSLHRNH